jgi:YgiT-type zinc finger domain-containing protein
MSEKCPICSGEIADGQTTFAVDVGSGVVVVRHVPARVCMQCGEDWIQDSTAERLEKIVSDARTAGKVVEVIDLQAA